MTDVLMVLVQVSCPLAALCAVKHQPSPPPGTPVTVRATLRLRGPLRVV